METDKSIIQMEVDPDKAGIAIPYPKPIHQRP